MAFLQPAWPVWSWYVPAAHLSQLADSVALAAVRHSVVLETHYEFIVRTGYVPPTPFTHYGRGSFFSSGVRAGLPPLSPDASCSVAVSLSPWGATRLGGAIVRIPLPTCGVPACST